MGDNTDDTQILRDAIENALTIADGQQRYLMAALLAHCLDELADSSGERLTIPNSAPTERAVTLATQ